jgi:hypothetical protein
MRGMMCKGVGWNKKRSERRKRERNVGTDGSRQQDSTKDLKLAILSNFDSDAQKLAPGVYGQ